MGHLISIRITERMFKVAAVLVSQSLLMTFAQETGFDNSCLYLEEGLNREGPREFDCPRFVIESTDQIWNMYRDFDKVEGYLRKYMVDDWESISVMGEYIRGYEKLEPLVLDTMIA